jgi:CRISPR-associated endonuclease/helicase Cas3
LERGDDGNVRAWLSVPEHAADVAAVCEALLERSVIGRRLARLAGMAELDAVCRRRLCVLAALHDIGKFNHGFQNRIDPGARPQAGHVREVVSLFAWPGPEREALGAALDYAAMEGWVNEEDGAGQLLLATLCHHGRPVGPEEAGGLGASLWHPDSAWAPFDAVATLRERTRGWYPEAWAAPGSCLRATPAFQHAWNGVVTLADWIGSDTRFFPLRAPGDSVSADAEHRIADSRTTAVRVVEAMGLDANVARRLLGPDEPGFAAVSPFRPRPAQQGVMGLPIAPAGSTVVLEASTGSGKTEAAIGHFLRLLHAGAVDGMYFALPTRTAATQIHRRMCEALARAFPDPAMRPPVVLAVPGYVSVDDQVGCRLAGFEVTWPDDDSDRWRFRGWAAETPKRYLAGAVVVGTIDQVLLSSLAVNHSQLRASALLRHLLVVDEVHASDGYMNRILEDVLGRHVRAGGHALLMSATLGAVVRERLLAPGTMAPIPSLALARAEPFPRIEVRADGAAPRRHAPESGPDRLVTVRPTPVMKDACAIAERIVEAAAAGARVLVIRNTVRGCLEVQAALEAEARRSDRERVLFECGGRPAPHHSRFTPEDRRLLDTALEAALGKHRPTGGCVVVATQTVQQSLDIDADLLVTDLCPMDVLLQRLGRLHRHDRVNRPERFREAAVDLLVPDERDLSKWIDRTGAARGPHGLGRVYEDLRVLEATWRVLEADPNLALPSECRRLVEDSLHPEVLAALTDEFGGRWKAHGMTIWGGEANRRQAARYQLANRDHPFGDRESLFPARELERRIQTRLGEGDRRVTLEEPQPSPFGGSVCVVTIPAWMVAGLAVPESLAAVADGQGGLRFVVGDRRFVYDRWGLRVVSDEDGATAAVSPGSSEEQTHVE